MPLLFFLKIKVNRLLTRSLMAQIIPLVNTKEDNLRQWQTLREYDHFAPGPVFNFAENSHLPSSLYVVTGPNANNKGNLRYGLQGCEKNYIYTTIMIRDILFVCKIVIWVSGFRQLCFCLFETRKHTLLLPAELYTMLFKSCLLLWKFSC